MAADYAGPSVDLSAQRHAAPARRTRPPHQPRPCVPERRVRLRNAGIPGTGTSPTPPPTAATPTHPRRPPNVGGGCVGGRPRDRWHTPWSVQREVASAPPPTPPLTVVRSTAPRLDYADRLLARPVEGSARAAPRRRSVGHCARAVRMTTRGRIQPLRPLRGSGAAGPHPPPGHRLPSQTIGPPIIG